MPGIVAVLHTPGRTKFMAVPPLFAYILLHRILVYLSAHGSEGARGSM
jgi:hypothetical protein